VGIVYLAALVIGAGTILLQLLISGDDGHADATVEGADLDLDADGGHAHAATDASGVLPIFLSLRFWTFGLLAFGLAGALLYYLELASAPFTAVLALALGLGSGFFASWVFRALVRADLTSGGTGADAIGQVGRMLLPCGRERRGKVRVELRGQILDFVATTDEDQIPQNALVLIEEIRGETAHVSPAPADFLPPADDKPRLS
jgi:membrane protein implicated in regulation of membrane protease activity